MITMILVGLLKKSIDLLEHEVHEIHESIADTILSQLLYDQHCVAVRFISIYL